MQMRFPDTPAGDLIYAFHKDSSNVQLVATPTLLKGAQGTVIAKVGSSPLILATKTSGGRAVDFTTYDFMHPDRFGFMMGVDDLVWRSLVWAARKPFILRGYPRLWASQMDDGVAGWGQRLQALWDTNLTGTVNATDGSGGPWKVNANAQLVNLVPGGQDRTNAIADMGSGYLRICLHTNTGMSEGDLYWNPQSSSPLTDAQWQTNLAYALKEMAGNGGSDTLPSLSKAMVAHYWNLSDNVGYDMWNSLGTRYITSIQMPGAYYSYPPPKPDSMRIMLHPFRIYEIPPTGSSEDELYPIYYADFMTVGSTAGLPTVKFFSFATQLLGDQFPAPDARWPNDSGGITVQQSVNNFDEYTWRFFSGMAPVQIYNHDSGSFSESTTVEAQAAITQISTFLNANHAIHVFMEDEGAYLCARTQSILTAAQATPATISLTFTGNATDMDANPVPTTFYLYYGDDEGVQQKVPGFTGGYTYSMANSAPAALGLSDASLTFGGLPGGAATSQVVTISNTGSATLTYTTQPSASWLTATSATGVAPDRLTITANPANLTNGVYTGSIQIISSGASNSPQVINVTFNVQGPTLNLSATSLAFNGLAATTNPVAQNITISNAGAGVLNWTAASNVSWLTLGATSGGTVTGAPYVLAVTPNIAGLQPGTYTGAITVASSNAVTGSPQTVNVTLTLVGILMQATFSSSSLDGWAYSSKSLASGWSASNGVLSYNGGGSTQLYAGNRSWSNYTVQAAFLLSSLTDYPGGVRGYLNPSTGASYAAWLYPAEGVIKLWRSTVWNLNTNPILLGTSAPLAMDDANWHTLSLSMNGGQVVASYDGSPMVTATDTTLSGGMIALDVDTVPIQFDNVLVTGNQVVTTNLTSPQSSFTFSVASGSTSSTQPLGIATSDGSVAAWSALSPSSWLTLSSSTGNTPDSATVQVNASALAAGSYSGQISLASFGATNGPVVLPVSVNVTQPLAPSQLTVAPAALSFSALSGADGPAAQTITLSASTSALAFTVSSDSTWLTSTASGTTPGSVQVSVAPSALAAGTYTGHLTISAPAAANPTTTVTVTLVVTVLPTYTLMQTTFANSTLDGWAASPLGLASGWSVNNNVLEYNGGGATQLYAGNSSWSNYTVKAGFLLSSLTDYPGGIRAYINPTTGAAYAAWLYPTEGVIKLFRTTGWNISTSPVLLGTSAHVAMDNVNYHWLSLSMNSGQVVVLYDGDPVVTASDTNLSGGMIALDVSNQPIQFNNVTVTGFQQVSTNLALTQSSLTFTASAGSTTAAQPLAITTSDGSMVAWSVLSSTPWLTGSSSSGLTPGNAIVAVNVPTLTVGSYSGQISVASFGAANSPVAVPVTVTITPPAPPSQLTVAPASLSFSALSGADAPVAQSLTLSASTSALAFTVSSDSAWLTATASGTTPASVQVNVASTGLAAGTYTGNLTISALAAGNPTTTVPVTLVVTVLPTYTLMQTTFSSPTLDGWAVSPMGLASGWSVSNNAAQFSGGGATQLYAGNATWSDYTVQTGILLSSLTDYPGGIRAYINPSTGASYVAWMYPAEGLIKLWRTTTWNVNTTPVLLGTSAVLTMDDTNWHTLALSMNAGQVVALYDGKPVVTATDTTLSQGMVALDVAKQPVQFDNVSVTGFQAETANLTSPQSSFTLSVVAGGTSSTQPLTIATSDESVTVWSALSPSPWLTIGSSTGLTPGNATVQVNASALSAGSYSGQINLASFGVTNNPIAIPVTVNVTPPAQKSQLAVTPASLSFSALSGADAPAAQSLTLTASTSALAFTVSSDSAWLTATASGTTPASVKVNVAQAGLVAGTYSGNLTISAPAAGNATTTVPVTLVVTVLPTYTLMQTTFASSTLDGWAVSPMGLASGWSVSNNVLQYNGGGGTQLYAGNSGWTNYTAQTNILLSSLADYPGGIRAYVNPATGASYAAWLYPAEGLIKLWRTTTWNISTAPVLLGTSAAVPMDDTNWHTLALSMNAGQVVVLYDGAPVVTATDTILSGGMIALDVSKQPVQFAKVLVTGFQAETANLTSPQSSYSFRVVAGGTSSTQPLTIATSDGSVAAWSALSASPWLTMSPSMGLTPGSATVQVNASALTAGSYSGQLNLASFGTANGPIAIPITVTVTSPPADFSITANPTALSISRGQSGTAIFTVTPLNGFNQTVQFACSGLPSEATCVFSPTSVTPNGSAATSQLTITTTAPTSAMLRKNTDGPGSWKGASGVVAVALLLFVLPSTRRKRIWKYLAMLLLAVTICLSPVLGCGGGGSSGGGQSPNPGTPTGTDTVTITASVAGGSSSTQHTAALTVTITN
jgi:hypothetical protein